MVKWLPSVVYRCEGLRLRLRTAKLSTMGNKATLVQRLLEHEGSHDPKHQQTDDSSSGSRDDRELGDRALTDEHSGSGCSRGPRGQMSMGRGRSQGPRGRYVTILQIIGRHLVRKICVQVFNTLRICMI